MNKILLSIILAIAFSYAGDTATIKLDGRYVNRVKCSTAVLTVIPKIAIADTTTSTSSTTGALVVSGGAGIAKTITSAQSVSDSIKIGSTGSVFTKVSIIDGASDTICFTSGGKTWKFLPVANQ